MIETIFIPGDVDVEYPIQKSAPPGLIFQNQFPSPEALIANSPSSVVIFAKLYHPSKVIPAFPCNTERILVPQSI